MGRSSPRARAVFQALFVTFLWSTSWVLIKIGLQDIPALSFAGLRYVFACLCLLPTVVRTHQLEALRVLSPGGWVQLVVLGLLYYSVTQGAQFLSLSYLPAATTSLLLSCTTILVAFLGIFVLKERPTATQWAGALLYLGGTWIYFAPARIPAEARIGIAVAVAGVLANALSSVLGRRVNRDRSVAPAVVTLVSMGIGGVVLLAGGIAAQGLPRLTLRAWLIVAWLAAVNSAWAFTLWNNTLRTLRAVESSMINNTMLVQVAVLAYLFLGERLTWRKVLGMALVAAGTAVVQLRRDAAGRRGLDGDLDL